MRRDRVRNIRLALGVYDGKVVEVYRVAGWFHTDEIMRPDSDIPPAEDRVEFVATSPAKSCASATRIVSLRTCSMGKIQLGTLVGRRRG